MFRGVPPEVHTATRSNSGIFGNVRPCTDMPFKPLTCANAVDLRPHRNQPESGFICWALWLKPLILRETRCGCSNADGLRSVNMTANWFASEVSAMARPKNTSHCQAGFLGGGFKATPSAGDAHSAESEFHFIAAIRDCIAPQRVSRAYKCELWLVATDFGRLQPIELANRRRRYSAIAAA